MGSIDQNLRSCAGVEKERRCGIPLTAGERWRRPTLVDEWTAERAAKRRRNPALLGRAIAYGKRGVGTAGSGDELTSSQGEPV
jgi:hypothetical protein